MTHLLAFYVIAFQETETPENWLTSWIVGEWVGKDWLLFFGGVVFFGVVSYALYAALIYNIAGSNRHPSTFRRLIVGLFLLLSILWFMYVFLNVFGGPVTYLLFGIWLGLVVVLILTRRKVRAAQA